MVGTFDEDYELAGSVGLTEADALRLCDSPHHRVRLALAMNPSIDRNATYSLLRDRTFTIALATARNPNCAVKALLDFLREPLERNHAYIADLLHDSRDPELMFSFWRVCSLLDSTTPKWEIFRLMNPRDFWTEDRFPFRWGVGSYAEMD